MYGTFTRTNHFFCIVLFYWPDSVLEVQSVICTCNDSIEVTQAWSLHLKPDTPNIKNPGKLDNRILESYPLNHDPWDLDPRRGA